MIALLLQAAPKVHHNLPKAIITLNSPEAIIAGDLLCGRLAKIAFLSYRTASLAAVRVFCMSMVMVIGPTPPGTGVM